MPARTPCRANRQTGFTFVELAAAIGVVGVISASALHFYRSHREASRQLQAVAEIGAIAAGLKLRWEDDHAFPEGLATTQTPAPIDPWGHPYAYHRVPARGVEGPAKDGSLALLNSDFDLYSVGPDGRTDMDVNHRYSADDVLRAHDGATIGKVGVRYRR